MMAGAKHKRWRETVLKRSEPHRGWKIVNGPFTERFQWSPQSGSRPGPPPPVHLHMTSHEIVMEIQIGLHGPCHGGRKMWGRDDRIAGFLLR